jgi:uncharacterized protein YjbI with pentapeptide repeats
MGAKYKIPDQIKARYKSLNPSEVWSFRWKLAKKALTILGIIAITVGIFELILVGYNVDWTGFNGHVNSKVQQYQLAKTLWDWMQLLIVPFVLVVIGIWYNRTRDKAERDTATDNQRENTLQTYFDRMSELLLENKLGSEPNALPVARARTLTALRLLDATRCASLLRFLSDAGLIGMGIGDDLTEINLFRVNLNRIHLKGVNLYKANLGGANLSYADLSNANLSGAFLLSANLRDANLQNTNLASAHLDFATLDGANLRGSKLCRIFLTTGHLNSVDLSLADLSEANIEYTYLIKANLSGANLSKVILTKIVLNKSDLSGADLSGAKLYGVHLADANLSNANLSGAMLIDIDLTNANLSGANLSDAELSRVKLDGAILTKQQLAKAKSHEGATMPDEKIHD